jgi:quinol monooxygenase YgiN
MSENVTWVIELKIKEGQLEAFKALMPEMIEATKSSEEGTLIYEWYISENNDICHVVERYADSAAAMVHLGHFGEKYAERFLSYSDVTRLTIYGSPSDELSEAMGQFDPLTLSIIGGFVR